MRDEMRHRIKSRAEQIVEAEHGASVVALLQRLYVEEGLSQEDVATRLGVGRKAVITWMAEYGIPTRDRRKVVAAAPPEAA